MSEFEGLPFTRAELLGASVEWLLEVTYAGRTFRFSERSRQIERATGAFLDFHPVMALDYDVSLETFSISPGQTSVAVELVFPVDIAQLVEQGHDLSRATGELSMLHAGRLYEDRLIVLRGSVVDPEYGAFGEPCAFSVEQSILNDTAQFPPSDARVNGETWPNFDQDADIEGAYYPFVFGFPGSYNRVTGSGSVTPDFVTGSPAYVVDLAARTVLIAGHEVEASNIQLFNETTFAVDGGLAVTSTTDGLGRTVSIVTATAGFLNAGDDIWVNWLDGAAVRQGGILNADRTGPLAGGGELMRYFLALSSLEVDFGRVAASSDYLDRFRFAGYVADAVTPLEWLQDNVLPLLPVSLISTPSGMAPVVWRREATARDAITRIDVSPDRYQGARRTGPVRYESTTLASELRLDYAYSAYQGAHRRTLALRASPESSGVSEYANAYIIASRLRYGERASIVLSSEILYDDGTAGQILSWMSRAHGFRHRLIRYELEVEYSFLRPGDVVLLEDEDLNIRERVCLVRSVGWRSGLPEIELVILEDFVLQDRVA